MGRFTTKFSHTPKKNRGKVAVASFPFYIRKELLYGSIVLNEHPSLHYRRVSLNVMFFCVVFLCIPSLAASHQYGIHLSKFEKITLKIKKLG